MVTLLWSAKGGSGTTVVASLLAFESSCPSLIIDLDGDVPAVLGMPEPERPGAVDWLVADGATSQLIDLVVDVDDNTALLPRGRRPMPPLACSPQRWELLVGWARTWEQRHDGIVVIDAGTGAPDAALAAATDVRWLVTRACYLSLRGAAASEVRPTGVVLMAEAGRALRRRDVQRSLAAPVLAVIDVDPAVARSVDSGLLVSRAPRSIRRTLQRAHRDAVDPARVLRDGVAA